jgi:acetolactate synthase-1/2/3 large subunit
MAQGYYRASGRIAPITTIPGPGFTYALTGLAEALHDSAALVQITGAPAGTDHHEHFQALDQSAIASALVKERLRMASSRDVQGLMVQALDTALAGEPGPVLLEWVKEALESTAPESQDVVRAPPLDGHDPESLAEAARRLSISRRPAIVAGQGSAQAAVQLQRLVELLGAPVITTTAGRGVLAEDHHLALGFDCARSSILVAQEFLERADAIVALGCKFGAGFRLELPSERVVRVDTGQDVLERLPGQLAIRTSTSAFIEAVLPAIPQTRAVTESGWPTAELFEWRHRLRLGSLEPEPRVLGSSAAAFFAALRAALPRDAIVVSDSGLHQMLLRRHFDVLAPRGLIVPSDFQSMGFGIPAAIGAKLAAPERQVVALIGDGGFTMSGLELLSAVREGVRLTVLVFADGALNHIRLSQLQKYGRTSAVTLRNPDYLHFAHAVGARYIKCAPEAERSLRQAIDSDQVSLVEVPVEDSVSFQAARLGGLARSIARKFSTGRELNSQSESRISFGMNGPPSD